MENKKIVEYYPSNEGLKNIYSKFLKFGSIEDLDNLILLYTNDTTNEEINAFLKLPFVKMNDSVIEKYRVDNWIKKLFS